MAEWKEDTDLKDALESYVKQRLRRTEILSYVCRDFSQYSWSLRTLARKLDFWEINYIKYNTPVVVVQAEVRNELNGPGLLLGYRALTQKLRIEHNLLVPRDVVHNIMYELEPDLLANRRP